jgi:Lysylphosphatidylglycerol synthase TM region
MKQSDNRPDPSKRLKPIGIIFALLGLLLFAYFVKRAGVANILENIKTLGAGLILVIAISSIRPIVRALAWTRCFEAPYRLRFRDALKARIMGDAIGNVVPLGTMIVGEPAKAVFVRKHVPLMAGFSSLAVENIFYSLSVSLLIFSGMAALLLSFPLPKSLRYASIGALVTVAVVILLAYLVIHKQWKFLSGAAERLYRGGIGRRFLETRRASISILEDRIYGFYSRNSSRFLPIILLEICFHLAGIAEAYVTLYFLTTAADGTPVLALSLLTAFILESVNRVITVVFKFMPFRVGVGEGSSEWFSSFLGFAKGIGTTLEIVRKARDLFWVALGFALLVHRGLSLRAVAEETQAAVANEVGAAQAPPAVPAGESS